MRQLLVSEDKPEIYEVNFPAPTTRVRPVLTCHGRSQSSPIGITPIHAPQNAPYVGYSRARSWGFLALWRVLDEKPLPDARKGSRKSLTRIPQISAPRGRFARLHLRWVLTGVGDQGAVDQARMREGKWCRGRGAKLALQYVAHTWERSPSIRGRE